MLAPRAPLSARPAPSPLAGRPSVARPARRVRAAAAPATAAAARAPAGTTLDLFSPSKINLFLRVVARRPDGFHDLASLFHVIDLGDGLTVEALGEGATEDELACEAEGVPTDGTNLVMKVRGGQERTGEERGEDEGGGGGTGGGEGY